MSINRLKVTKTLDATGATCLNVSADYLRHILIENFGTTETGVTGADVVINGCFEDSTTGWNANSGSVISVDTARKVCGAQSGKIATPAGDNAGGIIQYSELVVGTTYRISLWWWADSNVDYMRVECGANQQIVYGISGQWNYATVELECTVADDLAINFFHTAATTAFDAWIDKVIARPLETVALTDKMLRAVTRENGFSYPNDISQSSDWSYTDVTITDTDKIVPTVATGTPQARRIEQTGIPCVAGRGVMSVDLEEFRDDWVRFENDTSGDYAFFQISTGNTGTTLGDVRTHSSRLATGKTRVYLEFDVTGTSFSMRLFPATGDGALNMLGDGSTVTIGASRFHYSSGTLEQNIGFVDNGASASPRQLTVEITVDRIAKEESGLRQRADAISPHDGWEYPVPGTQYRLANGNFWEVFEGSMSGSESTTLTPVQSGSSTSKPFAIHSKGNISQDAGSDGKGTSYTVPFGGGAADYTGLRSTPGTTSTSGIFELYAGTTPRQVGYKYRAEIEYNYEYSAIPPA
jgi:hypothetical protein